MWFHHLGHTFRSDLATDVIAATLCYTIPVSALTWLGKPVLLL